MLVFPEDSVSIQRRELCKIIEAKYAPVIVAPPVVEEPKVPKKRLTLNDIDIKPKPKKQSLENELRIKNNLDNNNPSVLNLF